MRHITGKTCNYISCVALTGVSSGAWLDTGAVLFWFSSPPPPPDAIPTLLIGSLGIAAARPPVELPRSVPSTAATPQPRARPCRFSTPAVMQSH